MLGHSVDKYVTGTMVQTSNANGWDNLLAERWRHEAGELPSLVPRDTEIAVLLSGRSVVDRRGGGMRQHTVAKRGTIWLCPAGVEEEFISVSEQMDDCLHIFLPGRPFSDTILREYDLDPARIELRYEAIDEDPFIEFAANQILREMSSESAGGRLFIETLAVSLSAHLIRSYSGSPVTPSGTVRAEKPLDSKRLLRVEEYVDFHLDNDLTVTDLASIACMSVGHFTRAFKLATGKSPHVFVNDKRMALAKQRLSDENWTIEAVALAAGFSSHANFTRAFKNTTGMTPNAFRAVARGN
ncbi:AraC family transcriptional regulator [Agrobacterium larrymoorei]|uniref:AraC family transcriptional regulator n=1 Tax=Agrobacterium larrymoorei TaxID=160699 RepID=A0AAJ2BBP3_9HYPH|nr:AraC family transcriptional regulator [Agrobacterium larrymoorei]MDR6101687.1 AraC family transcriptional regulator [Agrobacterium larrymoorei]